MLGIHGMLCNSDMSDKICMPGMHSYTGMRGMPVMSGTLGMS